MFAKLYATAVPIFFAIDMIWLGLVAPKFYRTHIGHLLAPTIYWPAAIAFYLLFLAGLVVFAIQPALAAQSLRSAAALGALFGLITYATYDLTNHATMRDWPWIVTLADMAWGTVLCSAVSVITCGIARKWLH